MHKPYTLDIWNLDIMWTSQIQITFYKVGLYSMGLPSVVICIFVLFGIINFITYVLFP